MIQVKRICVKKVEKKSELEKTCGNRIFYFNTESSILNALTE